MKRPLVWILFLAALTLTLGLKAVDLGWFATREPLDLQEQPALLFFNKYRGCECELYVYSNANAQMDAWSAPMRIIHINMERRPDLAAQYGIIRAPSLVLLDAKGEVVWKQVESLSDESPLDLEQAQFQFAQLP